MTPVHLVDSTELQIISPLSGLNRTTNHQST